MTRLTAIMGGVVAIVLIVCVTFLIATGKSTGDLISLIGVGVMPILTLVLNAKLSEIKEKTGAIAENTNGTTSTLTTMVQELQAEVARRPLPPANKKPGT